jgi:hypothetical protein
MGGGFLNFRARRLNDSVAGSPYLLGLLIFLTPAKGGADRNASLNSSASGR